MADIDNSKTHFLSDDLAIDCALRIVNLIEADIPIESIKAAIDRSSDGCLFQCMLGLLEDIYL